MVEVEVGILDPQRVVQPARDLDQPAPERRQEVQATLQFLLDPVERVAPGHGRGVEHRDLQRVHVERRGLHVQEPGVEAGESLHVPYDATPMADALPDLADLRTRAARDVDDGPLPSCQYAVARDGELVAFETIGDVPAGDHTRYVAFSCTKAIT